MLCESRLRQPRPPRIQNVGHNTRHATWLNGKMKVHMSSKWVHVSLISFIDDGACNVSRWWLCCAASILISYTSHHQNPNTWIKPCQSWYNPIYANNCWRLWAYTTCIKPWQEKMPKRVHMFFTRYDCFSTIMRQPLWQLEAQNIHAQTHIWIVVTPGRRIDWLSGTDAKCFVWYKINDIPRLLVYPSSKLYMCILEFPMSHVFCPYW